MSICYKIPNVEKEQQLKISVIIPTLNRPNDMARLLPSIVNQTRLPDELIIVDQSVDDKTKNSTYKLLKNSPLKLKYIHDSSFQGLVKAKSIGVKFSTGDIVCFLDDDTILDKDYFLQILQGFTDKKDMLGCSGLVLGQKKSNFYLQIHQLFFQGIFSDNRPIILANINQNSPQLILCDILSGGASNWRTEVFKYIKFDTVNNLHNFEDTDFSTRAVKHYGHRFYLNTKAKLEHITDHNERLNYFLMQKRKIINALIFYKKRAKWQNAHICILLVLLWWLIESIILSIKNISVKPLIGYFSGILSGTTKTY